MGFIKKGNGRRLKPVKISINLNKLCRRTAVCFISGLYRIEFKVEKKITISFDDYKRGLCYLQAL